MNQQSVIFVTAKLKARFPRKRLATCDWVAYDSVASTRAMLFQTVHFPRRRPVEYLTGHCADAIASRFLGKRAFMETNIDGDNL